MSLLLYSMLSSGGISPSLRCTSHKVLGLTYKHNPHTYSPNAIIQINCQSEFYAFFWWDLSFTRLHILQGITPYLYEQMDEWQKHDVTLPEQCYIEYFFIVFKITRFI